MNARAFQAVPQESGLHLVGSAPSAADLASLLREAAAGSEQAFLRFYDATCRDVLALELARVRADQVPAADPRRTAESRVRQRFVTAWRWASRQPASGLSPRTWLLTLDVAPGSGPGLPADEQEASCA